MATSNSSKRPAWQRNPIFEFFASLKLAVVLLAVIIVAAIAGTLYESSFDANVARAYVYGAPWFNLWLVLLGANLTCSALSRWPWRKHHLAFLITHLGIITLLIGSLIGRTWGIEGTITLFKGEPPTNRLLVNERQLRVHDIDGIVKGYPAEFLHHPPTPQHPRDLGMLASGAHLRIIDYAPTIDAKLNPKPLNDGGAPALHFAIATAMMNQHLDGWLLADDPQNGNFSMGLANIELKRGTAEGLGRDGSPSHPPSESEASPKDQETDLEESIFAFSKAPEEQIGRASKGGSTGAKVRLERPQNGNKGRVLISLGQKEASFDVAENLGRDVTIADTPFTLKIDDYWADFRIENGNPTSVTDEPNNPAVLVTIRGKGLPASEPETNPHGSAKDHTTTGGPPTMPAPGEETPNHLTLFIADDGMISYDLTSRKNGKSTGKIDLNKPLPTGWADWQLTIDKTMPHAASSMDFNPVNSETASRSTDLPDGVRVRIQQNGENLERWAPAGWQIAIPTSPSPTMVAYGWKTVSLPIGLELLAFEVKRNEGSDSPAGFKRYSTRCDRRGRDSYRLMLDEPSIQLSGNLVAYLDGTYLQNFTGVLEPGKSRAKYRANFARSRLAIEMDRFTARRHRGFYDVLSSAVPKTNRRRTDYALGSRAKNRNYQRGSYRRNHPVGSAPNTGASTFRFRFVVRRDWTNLCRARPRGSISSGVRVES